MNNNNFIRIMTGIKCSDIYGVKDQFKDQVWAVQNPTQQEDIAKFQELLDLAAKETQMLFVPDPNRFGREIFTGGVPANPERMSRCGYCGVKHRENDIICEQCGAPP